MTDPILPPHVCSPACDNEKDFDADDRGDPDLMQMGEEDA